jgi:hypothetical protein
VKIPLGGGIPTTLAAAQGSPATIAVESANVYRTDITAAMGPLMKVPLAAGTTTTLARGQSNNSMGIAVDATDVYWTQNCDDPGEGTIGAVMKAPVGGGKPATLVSGNSPVTNTVDAANVYWFTQTLAGAAPMKLPPGGGAPRTLASGDIRGPIAVDATSV